ncbi:MAG TPA: hypothetical protein DCP54_11435 [Chryseobacterium sp.]|nr:hypothetical protein [Chryseobacterium sp.]
MLKILEWIKQFSSACNTAVRGAGSVLPFYKNQEETINSLYYGNILEALDNSRIFCTIFLHP